MVTVAICQFDPRLGDVEGNRASVERTIRDLASRGVELAVFPECALTGYVYESHDEAMSIAETVPGPSTDHLARICAETGLHAVFGLLERAGDRCYNTAALVGPGGFIGAYRKTHTLCLGVDRFTTPGEGPYAVYDLPWGRVGMLICYDLRFPEAPRALALSGAQAILLPTNWPVASSFQPDVFTRARAAENRVFVLAADRFGRERGATFLGRSQIVDPDGTVRQEASRHDPQVLIANVDLTEADRKNVVIAPGIHEMDCMADRRPDLYDGVSRVPELSR